jgi:Bacterial aa3 type cytochrome c oxidase subunit IV
MADHAQVQTADQTGDDFAAHEQTYRFFVKLVRWSLGVIVVILILLALFLT